MEGNDCPFLSSPPPVNQLRILLAVAPRLRCNALYNLLTGDARFLVMVEEPQNIDVLLGVRLGNVDVLVVTFERTPDVPPLVTHLQSEFPELMVVGISLEEQCARIYRRDQRVRTIVDYSVSGIIQAILESASLCGETDED
jgi:hypothetical protein